jgi:hypothetical protein
MREAWRIGFAVVQVAVVAAGRLAADDKGSTKAGVAAAPAPPTPKPTATATPSGPAPTSIILTNAAGVVGDTVKLAATLFSKQPDVSAKFLGREMKFLVDGHDACTAKIDTPNLAVCSWKVPSESQGTRPLEVRFAGDAAWAASKASAQILIVKAPTKLSLDDPYAKASPGEQMGFNATLTRTTDKEGIDGRLVTFNVNGQPAGRGTTVKGLAQLSYKVPKDFPGDADVEVFFAGDADYAETSAKRTIAIRHVHNGHISIVSAPNGSVGQELTYSAQLTQSGGSEGASGQTLLFLFDKWDGREWSLSYWALHAVTDSNGVARATGKPPTTLGYVHVRTDSTSNWVANEVTRDVTIGPSAVDVSAPDRSGAIGQTVDLKAHIRRASDGSPRASVRVVFEIGPQPVGADVTNASGDASVSVKLTSTMGIGKHALTAKTAGEADYKPGTGSGTLTIGASQR